MVAGMSVKSGEPRGGTSSQLSKKPVTQHTKTKPPLEAMQMARILEADSRYPKDLNDKIRQVQAIVPNRSEEEICIALHDSDFDPEKAISALLDMDVHTTGGQWTTSGGRKGKKKAGQSDGIDLIVAPGDTKTSGVGVKKRQSGGTNKAASTRETFGGGVNVSTDRVRGRGTSGRGRSVSGPRREGGKRKPPSNNTSVSDRRSRTNKERLPRTNKQSPPAQPPPSQHTVTDETWDTLPVENDRGQEVTNEEWTSWDHQTDKNTYWDVAEDPPPLQDETDVAEQPVFPEAIPSQQASLQLSTPSEATPTVDRDHTHPQLARTSEGQREEDRGKRKPRRIARSQIPTKPVEMPGEGDSLDLQFGSLGIDFGGSTPDPAHSTSVATGYDAILTYSDVHRLTEDPGVISVSSSTTSYRLAEDPPTETPAPTLEGPPGLTHPSSHDRSLDSHDQRLPSSSEALSIDHLSPSAVKEGPSLSATLPTSTETTVLQAPEPIDLPTQQKVSTTGGYSVSAASELLMPHTSTPSTAHMSTPSTTHTGTAASGKQGAVPPGMLYPHMVPQYPAFMPMYPAGANYGDPQDMSRYPASVSLAYYQGGAGDPTLSAAGGGREHYSTGDKFGRAEVSASVSQASVGQASQGGGLAGNQAGMQPAFMNYAYPSNMFYPAMYFSPAAAAHSMAPKPTSGGTTYPATSYQGGIQATGYNYDDVTSSHDYKMYSSSGAGSKSSNLPKTTAGGDMGLSSAYKQPHFDKQGASSNYQGFGLQNQQLHMGYMQMPTMPLPHIPVMPGGDSSSGRGGQKHSSKATGYQTNNYWGGHTS